MVTAVLMFWHIYIVDLNVAWVLRACSKLFVNLLDGGLLCYSKLSKQFCGICHHECRGDLMVTTILVFRHVSIDSWVVDYGEVYRRQ